MAGTSLTVPKVKTGRARHPVIEKAERFRGTVVSHALDSVKYGRDSARGRRPEPHLADTTDAVMLLFRIVVMVVLPH